MKKETFVNLAVLVALFAFLVSYYKPSLILSETTTSGGDTPSHHYLAEYLKDYLIPRGKIVGWSPDWYAGFPIFQFYFPLTYLLIALLSYLIPLVIAFKLITVLGIFLLPVCTLLSMRHMKFDFPMPAIAAIFTVIFLFSESYTFYGGNIPSTLAGEFSYSLSLSLMILLTGFLYEGIQSNRFLVRNSIVFFFMVFSHLYTTSVFILSSLFLLVKKFKKNFAYLFKFYLIGFLLLSFWLLPMLWKIDFTSSLGWRQLRDNNKLFLFPFSVTLLLTLFGILMAAKNREYRIFYLAVNMLVAVIIFFVLPDGMLFNARYLPFYYLFSLFIAAYGLNEIIKQFKIKNDWILVFAILALVIIGMDRSTNIIPQWIKWNYEGFESKTTWSDLSQLFSYLKSLPYGRVMHEYSAQQDIFGSPRALESIPYFTGKPVMEGLLIESALTSTYHFWMQSELASGPSCPISYIGCSGLNVERGLAHLKLFNVKYFIAYIDPVKNELKNNGNFIFLKNIDGFDIYEINYDSSFVTLPKYQPVIMETDDWKKVSLDWFKSGDLDALIVFTQKMSEDELNRFLKVNAIQNPTKIPVSQDCKINSTVENEEILIQTDCVGKPLYIKVPYFPNWQVEGADKIYLVSPSFMLIYPTKENVRLYYGSTPIDWIGYLLSLVGFLILIYKTLTSNLKVWLKQLGIRV